MKIICMGDSITYGYGLSDLSQRWSDLAAQHTGHELVNRGISGDTTGGMLARCQNEVFNQDADAVVFLGGINDISILMDYRLVCANVVSVTRQAAAYGVKVILGVPLPVCPEDLEVRAWDPDRDVDLMTRLCEQYAGWIRRYAAEKQIPVVDFRTPFLLSDGKGNRALFQDGLHPTEEGHRLMAEELCRVLAELN